MARIRAGLKGFLAVQRLMTDIMKCPTCEKSTAVVNIAPRGFRAERITPETHCTCPGGPVDLQTRGRLNPLHA